MVKKPYSNVERAQPTNMFPLDGETDTVPMSGQPVGDIEVAAGPGVNPADAAPLPEDSNVTMTEDGGAIVDLNEDQNVMISLGFGDNIAEQLTDTELGHLSSELSQLIEDDDEGREEWRDMYEKGLKLLGLTYEERTEPFQGATGVTHPILNEAVTQFQAQAYKELLPPGGPVRTRIWGKATPELEAKSQRVKEFMNFQITEVMEEYDPEYDQMLYYTGYGGSTFKKVYYDGYLGRATSPVIFPKDLIVPYNAKDLMTAERVTHVLHMSKNDLRKAQLSGFYRDVDVGEPSLEEKEDIQQETNKITGVEPGAISDNYTLYECHCNWEIPGFEHEDENGEPTGLKMPYIITIERDSGLILSIRRNYKEDDPKRTKKQYFVHYKFLPGLGFYGFGLVHLLGNLSRTATSLLRQLVDAGTLANLPAGFKAKGLRIQDMDSPLQPGEWRDVDAPGGNLRENLLPLPYKDPNATLFSLLGFVISSAEKFIGTTDLGLSDSNQEIPVGTTIAVLERGGRVMSAVHKRLHYAQKQELKLLAEVFADYLPEEYPYDVVGGDKTIKKSDFDDRIDVVPVSDPNIFSMTQRITLAQEQLKLAQADPASHNMQEAYRRMYAALGVQDVESLLNPPQQPQPMGPANENAQALNIPNGAPQLQAFPEQDHAAHIESHVTFAKLPLVQSTPAVMAGILAHIFQHIGFAAEQIVRKQNPQIEQQAQQGQQQQTDPNQQPQGQQQQPPLPPELVAQAAKIEAQLTAQILQDFGGQQGSDDPLVALKGRELDIREQDNARKAAEAQQQYQLDARKLEEKQKTDRERIAATQDIATMRVNAQLMKNGLM